MDREVIYKGETRIITPELIEIFHDSYEVNEESGCWIWTGRRNSDGYGVICYGGIQWSAHVLSYLIHNATEITVDKPQVRHACDDPPCVWGFHLQTGTNQDNSDDMVARGRQAKGETHGMYGRTGDQNPMYGRTGDQNPMYGMTGERCPAFGQGHLRAGEKNHNAKLTKADVYRIRQLKVEGLYPAAIARELGLSYHAVSSAYQGRTWKHLL